MLKNILGRNAELGSIFMIKPVTFPKVFLLLYVLELLTQRKTKRQTYKITQNLVNFGEYTRNKSRKFGIEELFVIILELVSW
jgi:hypothetical protein